MQEKFIFYRVCISPYGDLFHIENVLYKDTHILLHLYPVFFLENSRIYKDLSTFIPECTS